MEFEEFKDEVIEKMQKIDININEIQAKRFYQYMNLLIEWNKKINLTAITDPKDVILKHFVDSATISKYIKNTDKIADIGTGAGFPGIPLKIIKANNEMVLIDSLNKRINFLQEIIKELKLQKVEAIHTRAEEIGHNLQYRQQYDVVISRAVAKLNVLLEYMLPITKVGGTCICLKGPNIEEELAEAKNSIEILGGKLETVEKLILPQSDNERTIIVIKSVKQIPNKYPRKPGTPGNSPL